MAEIPTLIITTINNYLRQKYSDDSISIENAYLLIDDKLKGYEGKK